MAVNKIIKNGKPVWGYDVIIENVRHRKYSVKWNRKQAIEEERNLLTRKGEAKSITYNDLWKQYVLHKKPQLKDSTMRKHEATNRLHIAPTFGDKEIAKIKNSDIIGWQIELLDKNFSANTLRDIQNLFHAVLNFGLECEMIDRNPFFKRVTKIEHKEEAEVWTPSQFEQFASVITDPTHDAMYRLLYYGGLRKGEMIALNMEDYDGKGVWISKTYDRVLQEVTPPKTNNSYRYVELDKHTCEAIDKMISLNPSIEEASQMPLFGFYHRISFTSLERWKDEYWKKTDLPYLTLHGFRHSHASYLLEKGIRPRDVALRLGNTEAMVIKRYSHILNKSQSHITALFE